MTYTLAKKAALDGNAVRCADWDGCRIVRLFRDEDFEQTNYAAENLLVEDCKERICDCKVAVYVPSKKDKEATNWEVV